MATLQIIRRVAIVLVAVGCMALSACGLVPTISEAEQGKAFVQLLKTQGFKEVGTPEWEDDSEKTTRKIGGVTVKRTSTERVVEVTARVNGCTAEFEQVRNRDVAVETYVLDEFQGKLGTEIDVDEGTEVGNLTPDQVSKYISTRREGPFKPCYVA